TSPHRGHRFTGRPSASASRSSRSFSHTVRARISPRPPARRDRPRRSTAPRPTPTQQPSARTAQPPERAAADPPSSPTTTPAPDPSLLSRFHDPLPQIPTPTTPPHPTIPIRRRQKPIPHHPDHHRITP